MTNREALRASLALSDSKAEGLAWHVLVAGGAVARDAGGAWVTIAVNSTHGAQVGVARANRDLVNATSMPR